MKASPSKEQSLGRELMAARKARGWNVEEAAHITKLRTDVIHKIEDDRFDLLPNHAYARGFVRIYARELGLDVFAILKKLDGIVDEEVEWTELRPESLEILPPKSNLQRIRPRHIGLLIVLGCFLAGLGIIGFYLYRIWPTMFPHVPEPVKEEVVQPATPAKTAQPVAAPANTPPPKALPANPEEEIIKPATPADDSLIRRAEPVATGVTKRLQTLRLKTIAECYARVTAINGGQRQVIWDDVVPAGTTLPTIDNAPWQAESFQITVRDTKLVDFILNEAVLDHGRYPSEGIIQLPPSP